MAHNPTELFRACIPLFTTLSDPARQDIILLLAEEEPLSVNAIVARSHLSRPAVSHHLKILREQQLIQVEHRGTQHLYSLALETGVAQLKALIVAVEETCLPQASDDTEM